MIMWLVVFVLVVTGAWASAPEPAERTCEVVNVTRCLKETVSTDVIFLVDSSDSMYREVFYSQMLDYVQDMHCVLNVHEQLTNQAGVILFSNKIRFPVLLGEYSKQEWNAQVETIRNDQESCCKCCTPLAEAFLGARDEFVRRYVSPRFDASQRPLTTDNHRGRNEKKIVVVITDGTCLQAASRPTQRLTDHVQ